MNPWPLGSSYRFPTPGWHCLNPDSATDLEIYKHAEHRPQKCDPKYMVHVNCHPSSECANFHDESGENVLSVKASSLVNEVVLTLPIEQVADRLRPSSVPSLAKVDKYRTHISGGPQHDPRAETLTIGWVWEGNPDLKGVSYGETDI